MQVVKQLLVHPWEQIQMRNPLIGNTNIPYNGIIDHDGTNSQILYDDIWISILSFCNVKEFLSLNKTCHYLNKLTKNKQDMSNSVRINEYWYDQCKVLCSQFITRTMRMKTNRINFFLLYQELFIIISHSIAIKYKNKLNDAMVKHLIINAYASNINDMQWKMCFKRQLERNLFQIQAKCYFDYLTTAPHSETTDDHTELYETDEAPKKGKKQKSKRFDWLRYKNSKHRHFNKPFKYHDFKRLLSDSDLCVLPFKLLQVRGGKPKALICDIIKHDCIKMFKLYTKSQLKFENRCVDETIREMYSLETSIYHDLDFTLFGASCHHGSLKIFNYLLTIITSMKYCNQNSEKDGKTPLMVAAEAPQIEIVKLLLPIVKTLGNDEISRTTANEYCDETALHCAIFEHDEQVDKKQASEIALLLIENCIDINIGSTTNSALHYACSGLYFEVIKELVRHRNIKYNIDTCYCDDPDHIELEPLALYSLIKRVCIQHNHKSIMEQFKQLINFIIDYGTKTNNNNLENILIQTKDKNNITPLRYALHPLVENDVNVRFLYSVFVVFLLYSVHVIH